MNELIGNALEQAFPVTVHPDATLRFFELASSLHNAETLLAP